MIVVPPIPGHFVLEVLQKKTAVVESGEFVLKDQAGRICADVLEGIDQLFVMHSDCHEIPAV